MSKQRLQNIKEQIDEAKEEFAIAKSREKELLKILKDHGVSTIDEAKTLQDEILLKVKTLTIKSNRMMKSIEHELEKIEL